jgi:hypothetical protein
MRWNILSKDGRRPRGFGEKARGVIRRRRTIIIIRLDKTNEDEEWLVWFVIRSVVLLEYSHGIV